MSTLDHLDTADTGQRWLEVQMRGPRGTAVRELLPHDGTDVTGPAAEWVRDRLAAAYVPDVDPRGLVATLHTGDRRTTLMLPADGGRATVDRRPALGLRARQRPGRRRVVVETGSGSPPRSARPAAVGARPPAGPDLQVRHGLVLLTPGLPRNRWHRVTTRHLGIEG